jgi:hypothetical protein
LIILIILGEEYKSWKNLLLTIYVPAFTAFKLCFYPCFMYMVPYVSRDPRSACSARDVTVTRHFILCYCLVEIRKYSLLTATCRFAVTGRL